MKKLVSVVLVLLMLLSVMTCAFAENTLANYSDDQLKQVNEKFPYYKIGQIPQETYKYLTKDYNTVQIWYDVPCAPDMDEDTVYNIVKGAYGSVDSLAQVSSLAQFLYPENLEFCSVPLHKGAVKFYQEAGVEIPAEIMPQ